MARSLYVLALVVLTALLLTSGRVLAQAGGVEQSVVIVLPGNTNLPPGEYVATIQVGSNPIRVQLRVPAGASTGNQPPAAGATPLPAGATALPPQTQTASASQPAPPAAGSLDTSLLPLVLGIVATLGLVGAIALVYFKVITPRRQFKPYQEALALIKQSHYQDALPLLTGIEGKLPEALRHEARFFIAFLQLQLKDTGAAEYNLKTLFRENDQDANVAYLYAYLLIHESRYDDAERVLEKMESRKQLTIRDARKLLGLVKFRRGLKALQDGRLEAAEELFEKVKELGDYADRIPPGLRNRYVVLGTKALFDKDLDQARNYFEDLEKSAANVPEAERAGLQANAELGLALLCWLQDEPDGQVEVEKRLVNAARYVAPHEPIDRPWPSAETQPSPQDKLRSMANGVEAEARDTARCLRDIHFLRGMGVLRAWLKQDGKAAHAAMEEQYDRALARFACAYASDHDFADVQLVVGLLKYYLHKPGAERQEGVDLLEQAQKHGVREPDAMQIINNRERIAQANADAVDKYLQVLDLYVNDPTVRKEVRVALLERLSQFKRVRGWVKRPDLSRARNIEPSVAEMRKRSEIILVRVQQLLEMRGASDETARLRSMTKAIVEDSERLYKQSREIEEKESTLLAETGNQLFSE